MWRVQHNRVWALAAAGWVVVMLLLVLTIVQTARFRPRINYVTLEGGYPVTWNQGGNAVIDGVEYVPARLRATVSTFIDARWAYDWQDLGRIRTALNLMDSRAAEEERDKIRELDPATNVVGTHLKVDLKPDYATWHVAAEGKGTFRVTVNGVARINDLLRYPDPARPLVKRFTVELVVRSQPATDDNPNGYVVVSTSRDPIL
jgi:hypothetical protein